jgi:large subunit ribosomal protein L4
MKINIYNQEAKVVGELELADKTFAIKPKADLIHQAVVAQMGNARQVLAHTKTKAEVRGGGIKPWRQKGTGRARAGSSRSPLWEGGGVIFGPRKDRNFSKDLPKKMKQKAMLMVFSDKISNSQLVVLDDLKIEAYKTKVINQILKNIETEILKNKRRSLLLINGIKNDKIYYSTRNLPDVSIINLENLNIVDLVRYKNVVLTKNALELLAKRYTKTKLAK